MEYSIPIQAQATNLSSQHHHVNLTKNLVPSKIVAIEQIRLASAGGQGAQQLVTLAGGQQIAVQMQPQVMQFPTAASTQQTMMQTVQIPVSQVSFLIAQLAQSDPRNSFLCLPYIFLFVLAFS